jgi:hypothetical protein
MNCFTKLTLLVLLTGNFLQAATVNFAAEFNKAEKMLPFDKALPRHERYAQYLYMYAMESCSDENGMDIETAKKACQEMLAIKNLSTQMRSVALDLLANISGGVEQNYTKAVDYLNQLLAMPDLDTCTYKLVKLNKEQFELLAQGKKIDEQAYQAQLAVITQEAEEMLKAMYLAQQTKSA